MTAKGHIDRLKPEGVLLGWCVDEADPQRRVDVTVLVDGVLAGAGVAGIFREDLLKAGIGDGFHAFSIVLPWCEPNARRARTICLRDTISGEMIGEPYVHHDRLAIEVDERLYQLEAAARQLEMQLAEVTALQRRSKEQSELFGVVGAFFTQLAEDARRGVPLAAAQQLGGVIERVVAAHPLLELPAVERPLVTICLEATVPLDHLYAAVAALLRAGATQDGEIVLLDFGAFDDAVLLPLVVRGLRYCRAGAGRVHEYNEILRRSGADIVLFLNGQALVEPAFAGEILQAFARSPRLAAAGGTVIGADGRCRHGGLVLQADGRLSDCAAGFADADTEVRAVHALSHQAIALRRSAAIACGELHTAFGTIAAAMLDLCLRMGQAGWALRHLPAARLHWQTPAAPECVPIWSLPRLDAPGLDGERLAGHWHALLGAPPPLRTGTAAIVAGETASDEAMLQAAEHLLDAGYASCYLGPAPDAAMAAKLQRRGARLLTCDSAEQLAATLADLLPDLVYMPEPRATALPAGKARVVAGAAALARLLSAAEAHEAAA